MTTSPPHDGEPVSLRSSPGSISGRYDAIPGVTAAALLLGGIDGGFDGPAGRLYPDVARDLLPRGIASLRLDFRVHSSPGNLDEAVFDVFEGIGYLEAHGILRIGLVGHSFGAAVAIVAGTQNSSVTTVVSLSAQTAGTAHAGQLAPRPLLLIHGAEDRRLPPSCSETIFARAGEPKQLIILPEARHSLGQQRETVRRLVVEWLDRHLSVGP